MKWEELTAPDFRRAVEEVEGVCILPLGVIEKHGEHLPLGTDLYRAREFACRAAELEPAIVFPPYYFTQIHEGKHQPGAIAIRGGLMFDLLENVCDEISRNGLKKIIFLNSHGGNNHFLRYFIQLVLEREKDYTIYLIEGRRDPEYERRLRELKETEVDGHAGETETSEMMVVRPDLVRMGNLPEGAGMPLKRLSHLPGLYTAVWWYADFPDHYAGDGHYGTREKGELLLEHRVRMAAQAIRAVKEDTEVPRLQKEFFSRTRGG